MRKTLFHILSLLLTVLTFSACGSSAADNAILEENIVPINTELAQNVRETPAVESIALSYADADLKVDIKFAGQEIEVPQISEALVQYALAIYLKSHTGIRLDNIVNALGRLEGKMTIVLTDCDMNSRTYEVSATRIKQLIRQRPMELKFNEVRSNVLEIMNGRTEAYRTAANAAGASFAYSGGFAEYTLTFPAASSYRQYNRGNLTGHYVNILKPQYESFGAMRPFVEQILASLQIEGYRFVYTTERNDAPLKALVPWRLIN